MKFRYISIFVMFLLVPIVFSGDFLYNNLYIPQLNREDVSVSITSNGTSGNCTCNLTDYYNSTYINDTYVPYTNANKNIDIGYNNFTGTGNITASNFFGTSNYSTISNYSYYTNATLLFNQINITPMNVSAGNFSAGNYSFGYNITVSNCIFFSSGGKICSGT